MILLRIALRSILNRKLSSFLSLMSIALSVCLLLGIERIRYSTKQSFETTVSGVDLIMGPRTGPLNLLLYSVFRIGDATNNFEQETYKEILKSKSIDWSIPISLGDSHKGFKVIGTNQNYFDHYQYGQGRKLEFRAGQSFETIFEVVLGSRVARKLKYKIGDLITLSHGTGDVSFTHHDKFPFVVVGILKSTLTPVDDSLHVNLKAIEALHWDEEKQDRLRKGKIKGSEIDEANVTAAFLKLKSKMDIFNMQRDINNYEKEAIMAVIPGLTLRSLWKSLGVIEKSLIAISFLVLLVSLFSILISLLASLNERRREMAIIRSLGASKGSVFFLLIVESVSLCSMGILLGLGILQGALFTAKGFVESRIGLSISPFNFAENDIYFILLIFVGSVAAGIVPAWQAYRNSLADGLIVKT